MEQIDNQSPSSGVDIKPAAIQSQTLSNNSIEQKSQKEITRVKEQSIQLYDLQSNEDKVEGQLKVNKKGSKSSSQQQSQLNEKQKHIRTISQQILGEIEETKQYKTIMCKVTGHSSYPLIFAYITKQHSEKRLLCMQCFKENGVIDKKQLLELAKLQVDYGQFDLAEHRTQLRNQQQDYIETLQTEQKYLLDNLQDIVSKYREQFLQELSETHLNIQKSISHQIEYRKGILSQNMERLINAKVPEEVVEECLYGNQQLDHEKLLNLKFTEKGLILFDRYNRKPYDLQQVEYMLSSKVTYNQQSLHFILESILESVSSMRSQFVVPDVYKHEQLSGSQLLNKNIQNIVQPLEVKVKDRLNIEKQQVVTLFCIDENCLDNENESQKIRQILPDYSSIQQLILKQQTSDCYQTTLKQSFLDKDQKSRLIFIKYAFNEKSAEDIIFQNMFKAIGQSQQFVQENQFENKSIILTKEICQNINQVSKLFQYINKSELNLRCFCFTLSHMELDEKKLCLLFQDIKPVVQSIVILTFDLSSNKLGDSSSVHLKAILNQSQFLRKLNIDLSANGFGFHNCLQLSGIISRLKTLVFLQLNLKDNKIEDQGCINLGSALKQLTNLTQLSLFLKYLISLRLTYKQQQYR